MLPQTHRLSKGTFPKKRPQQRHQFSWGAVSFYPAPTLQCAVIVSKKTLKNATDRNRVRRRLYNAARTALTKDGVFVLTPKREALHTPFEQLIKDLAHVASK